MFERLWGDVIDPQNEKAFERGCTEHETHMLLFIRFSVLYFLFATVWNFFLRDDLFFVGAKLLSTGMRAVDTLLYFGLGFAFFTIWVWIKCKSHAEFGRRVLDASIMIAFCCLFMTAFSSVKSSLPYAAQMLGAEPFFADPFLAEFDRALHFGVDPWALTHKVTEMLGWDGFALYASIVYGPLWLILSFYLPTIMVFVGEDKRTVRHYVILYAFSWIVLGNVIALLGQSGGPIYYDRITDTLRFADLHASLAVSGGMANSFFSIVQDGLWDAYINQDQSIGSGIAAFPSLHLGMITIGALYLMEKHIVLRVFGLMMVACILFISVWVGYHYAIDGYFSILVICGAHFALKRWAASGAAEETEEKVPHDAIQNA